VAAAVADVEAANTANAAAVGCLAASDTNATAYKGIYDMACICASSPPVAF
jgi:hypothetical protein